MYATEADLVRNFGSEIEQLKRMWEDSEGVVQNALQYATEEINGYIFSRYALPLPNTPSNLNRIACDIARYRLYFQQPTEHVIKLYDDAINYLKRVQDKKADLPIIDSQSHEVLSEQPQNKPSTLPIGTTYTGGVFGDSTLNKMPSM